MSSLRQRAFKPVYLLYYRLLFGRRFPGADALARKVHAFELATQRGDAPSPKDEWETQYRAGGWQFMRALDELGRYAVIAAFAQHLAPAGAVLDVGCGEGLLLDELRWRGYRRYLGVDLAEAAITAAGPRRDERTDFVAADAETFASGERFDVIVFNESVYYFHQPLATLRRYESMLAPGGALIVSMFRSRRSQAIARLLEREYALRERTAVSNRKGTWVVSVLAPLGADGERAPAH
jgi:2-polyprenyl-3-methyl-5-hydroxy-6-metoxy-1,4-benzoquinol methylase